MNVFAKFFVVSVASVSLSIQPLQAADPLDPIKDALEDQELGFYRPIGSIYGPGWVFQKLKDDQGNEFLSTICVDAYYGVNGSVVTRENIIIPSGVTTKKIKLSFGLGLLEKLFRGFGSLSAQFSKHGYKVADISWGDVQLDELSDRFQADGTERTISESCAASAKNWTNNNGKFENPTYIVMRAAAVRKLDYCFYKIGGLGANENRQDQGSNDIQEASSENQADNDAACGNPLGSEGNSGSEDESKTGFNIAVKEYATISGNITTLGENQHGFKIDIPSNQSPIYIGANAKRVKTFKVLDRIRTSAEVEFEDEDLDISLFDDAE